MLCLYKSVMIWVLVLFFVMVFILLVYVMIVIFVLFDLEMVGWGVVVNILVQNNGVKLMLVEIGIKVLELNVIGFFVGDGNVDDFFVVLFSVFIFVGQMQVFCVQWIGDLVFVGSWYFYVLINEFLVKLFEGQLVI